MGWDRIGKFENSTLRACSRRVARAAKKEMRLFFADRESKRLSRHKTTQMIISLGGEGGGWPIAGGQEIGNVMAVVKGLGQGG